VIEAPSFIEKLSYMAGIAIVSEDAAGYQGRVLEVRSYHERRHEIASEAAGEYRSHETARFAKDTLAELKTLTRL